MEVTSPVFGDNSTLYGESVKLPVKSIGEPSAFSLHFGSYQSFPFEL